MLTLDTALTKTLEITCLNCSWHKLIFFSQVELRNNKRLISATNAAKQQMASFYSTNFRLSVMSHSVISDVIVLIVWPHLFRRGSNIIHSPSRIPRVVDTAQKSVFDRPVHPWAPSCVEAAVREGLQTFRPSFSSTFTGQVGTPEPLQHILHLPLHLPQVCSQAPTWRRLSNYLWRSQIWICPSPRDTMHHGGLALGCLWTPQSDLKS